MRESFDCRRILVPERPAYSFQHGGNDQQKAVRYDVLCTEACVEVGMPFLFGHAASGKPNFGPITC